LTGSVLNGEWFLKEVYEAVRNGPDWNQTMFVIYYDEHGGFCKQKKQTKTNINTTYIRTITNNHKHTQTTHPHTYTQIHKHKQIFLDDHVAPPQNNIPNPDGRIDQAVNFTFDRLGIRVPFVLISPWVDAGVEHEPNVSYFDVLFSFILFVIYFTICFILLYYYYYIFISFISICHLLFVIYIYFIYFIYFIFMLRPLILLLFYCYLFFLLFLLFSIIITITQVC
jgi:hypothetical protein